MTGHFSFDGHIDLDRPLAELVTVFDMAGVEVQIGRDYIRSLEHGFEMHLEGDGVRRSVRGIIDDALLDPVDLLAHVALALEADGVGFSLTLYDTQRQRVQGFAPIG